MRTPDDIVDFLIGFASRQASEVVEVPGGVAVRHRDFPASYNNNRLLIREAVEPAALLMFKDRLMFEIVPLIPPKVPARVRPLGLASGIV